MGEEFYAAIKLVTSEEIFSLVSIDENDGDPVVVLQNPVTIKTVHHNHGMVIKIKPWMEIPNDDFFIIKLDKIVTITEIKDKNTINLYKKYLNDDYSTESKVNITNKMGYISSVEEARKKLERIFKGLKEK